MRLVHPFTRVVARSIAAGVVLALLVTACGGSPGGAEQPAAISTATPTESAAEATATSTPLLPPANATLPPATATPAPATAMPTSSPRPATATPASGASDDLIAQGKLIYEQTAGGVGCALCHGIDGRGDPQFGAPPNRGATEEQIWGALESRPQMSFLTMTVLEVKAVASYLQWLATQP